MKRFAQFLSSLLIVGTLALGSVAAHAKVNTSTTDLGTLAPNATIEFDNAFSGKTNKFVDYFTFNLANAASFSSVTSSFSLGNLYGIDHLQVRLYSGDVPFNNAADPLASAWITLFDGPFGLEAWNGVLFPLTLSAASYTLQVSGKVNGLFGGMYEGALSVSPIPEPSTYAMLLVGLALFGFAARRRSQGE